MDQKAIMTALDVFSFGMGATIASFLNVVIWRVPRGESIVSPPSHCPECSARIRWWQNVPIVSWVMLRGRCASCRKPISIRYPLVESLGGVLFLAAFWHYGWLAPLAWIWMSLMIVGSFIDLEHQLLPDFVTIGGMVLGVSTSVAFWAIGTFTPWHFHNLTQNFFFVPPLQSLAGLALGFSLLWCVRSLGTLAFRREAMGMGDVFLMGAVGALFGPTAVVATLILSAMLGSVVGIVLILLAKARLGGFTAIPFGPFICGGCLVWMFCGPELVRWYMQFLIGN